MFKIKSHHEKETFALAKRLGSFCSGGTSFLLDGNLAAGKTVFAKGLGSGLGVEGNIKSPSYTLMCEYEGNLPFYHFDAYNLEGIDDFYGLGFDEFLYKNGVVLIEWGSVLGNDFPEDYIHVEISKEEDENERTLEFTAHGEKMTELLEEWWQHENIGV